MHWMFSTSRCRRRCHVSSSCKSSHLARLEKRLTFDVLLHFEYKRRRGRRKRECKHKKLRSPVETTHRVRGLLMSWFELFVFATLFALAAAMDPRPLNTARLYIAVYCHKEFVVEELFFAPAVIDELQLVTNGGRKKCWMIYRFCASYSCTLRPCSRPSTSVVWCADLWHFNFWSIDDSFEAWTCRGWYWSTSSFILMWLWWIFIGHCWSYLGMSLWGKSMKQQNRKGKHKRIVSVLCLHVWYFSTIKVKSDYSLNSFKSTYCQLTHNGKVGEGERYQRFRKNSPKSLQESNSTKFKCYGNAKKRRCRKTKIFSCFPYRHLIYTRLADTIASTMLAAIFGIKPHCPLKLICIKAAGNSQAFHLDRV